MFETFYLPLLPHHTWRESHCLYWMLDHDTNHSSWSSWELLYSWQTPSECCRIFQQTPGVFHQEISQTWLSWTLETWSSRAPWYSGQTSCHRRRSEDETWSQLWTLDRQQRTWNIKNIKISVQSLLQDHVALCDETRKYLHFSRI